MYILQFILLLFEAIIKIILYTIINIFVFIKRLITHPKYNNIVSFEIFKERILDIDNYGITFDEKYKNEAEGIYVISQDKYNEFICELESIHFFNSLYKYFSLLLNPKYVFCIDGGLGETRYIAKLKNGKYFVVYSERSIKKLDIIENKIKKLIGKIR